MGVETVIDDAYTLKALVKVLRGDFESVTVAELQAAQRDRQQEYVVDGLFAIPSCNFPSRSRLPPETRLLQVAAAGDAAFVYVLEEDSLTALNLAREAHVFDLLCAHAKLEHVERHLATHVATLQRMEANSETGVVSEQHILINSHPAFANPLSVTGMVNEPPFGESPTMKITYSYARFLANDDRLMTQHGLTQLAGAEAAWREHMCQPMGAACFG